MLQTRPLCGLASILLTVGLSACGGGGSGSGEKDVTEGTVCRSQSSGHSGCCSSHGGFGGQCASGEALYGEESGRLVCNDGEFSPTCTFSLMPVEEMAWEYDQENGL